MNTSIEMLTQHDELFNQLSNIQKGLLIVSENADDDFLKLGQQLQSGNTSVSKLADLALSAKKTEADSGKNDFSNATHSVNKTLKDLKIRRKLVESKYHLLKKSLNILMTWASREMKLR